MSEETADLFREFLWDNLVKAALRKLFTRYPFLGWGPVGVIISYFAVKWSEVIYEGVKMFIDLQQIAIKNEQLKREFDSASVKCKLVARNYGIHSEEFKSARKTYSDHLSNFVRFDVAR